MTGSTCLGLMWGWLLVLVSPRTQISLSSLFKFSAATAIVSAEVKAFVGTVGLIAFLSATGVTLLMHIGWMQELKSRFRA